MYARLVPQIPSAAYQDPAKPSPTIQYAYQPSQRVSSIFEAWRLEPRDAPRSFRSDTVLTPRNCSRCRHKYNNHNRNRARRQSRYTFAEVGAAALAVAPSGAASAQYSVASVSVAAAERAERGLSEDGSWTDATATWIRTSSTCLKAHLALSIPRQ